MLGKIIAFLLVLSFFSVKAEDLAGFRSGYIVTLEGDTIIGEIKYLGNIQLSTECNFRTTDAPSKKYFPANIKGYAFKDGRKFVSEDIQGTPYFLELLQDGIIDIYYLKTAEIKDTYFIDKKGEKLTRVTYKTGFVNDPFASGEVSFGTHKGILNYFLSDAPGMTEKINKIDKPSHRNLMNLARSYQELKSRNEPVITHYSFKKRLSISVESVTGTINFENTDRLNVNFQDKFYFNYGALLNINIPRTSENIYVRTGLMFSSPIANNQQLTYYTVPLHIAYMGPREWLIRPMLSIDLLSPTYSTGFYINVSKNIAIGTNFWVNYYNKLGSLWVPDELSNYAALLNVQYRIY